MKPRQKRNSNKIIHMAIQPVRQLYNNDSEHRSQANNLINKQVTIEHNITSHHGPSNKTLQQLPQTHSITQSLQSSIQPQQQPNSGNIEQKQLLIIQHLTTNYIHDHYQHILRPLALSFTKYTLWFVLIFGLLKIFWVYEEILQRRDLQEEYLRNIMIGKIDYVKNECQHMFAFLDQVQDLLQMERNDVVTGNYTSSSRVSNCSELNNKYMCNNLSMQFMMSIDSNYDMLALEIASLMAGHINIANVFVMNLNTLQFIQFNLTNIFQNNLQPMALQQDTLQYTNYLLSQQSSTLQPTHITQFTNFISTTYNNNSNSSSTSTKQFTSYLYNSGNSYQQSYELYQIFLFDQQSVTQQQLLAAASYTTTSNMYKQMWNLYCLNIVPTYYSIAFPSKLCVSIKESTTSSSSSLVSTTTSSSSLQPQQPQPNIYYIDSNYTKILITNSSFITSFTEVEPSIRVYQLFSEFITSTVQPMYPQYSVNGEAILDCLRFQQSFYQYYTEQQNVHLQILRCYGKTYMHMLISQYIFAWGHISANAYPYNNLLPISFYNYTDDLEIELFYLSNLTYYSDIHNISTKGISIIQLTIKIYLAILIVALFTFQLSTNVIQNIMIQSIFTIKRLAKVVLSVDDVKKAQNQFKKIIKQIEQAHSLPYTPILGTIIGYLQKFLWIKKLYHNNKKFSQHKSKKYNILFQGLNLFKYLNVDAQFPQSKKSILQRFYQSKKEIQQKKHISTKKTKTKSQKNDIEQNQQLTQFVIKDNYIHHSGVLMYIYRQLAYLQKEKISKFKNIQILSRRKSSKIKWQQMNNNKQIKQDSRRDNPTLHIENPPSIPLIDIKQRQNRSVRFSNNLKFKDSITNTNEKKPRFKPNIASNSSIGNKSQLKSIKSMQIEKQQQQQQSSEVISQSSKKKQKRQVTMKNILRGGDESVHEGLRSMKFDDNSNAYEKQSMLGGSSSILLQSLHSPLSTTRFSYTHEHALQQTLQSYQRILHYYEQMVDIQQSSLNYSLKSHTIPIEQMQQRANIIYYIELKRVKILYEYLQLLIDERVYGEEEEVDFEELGVDVRYERLGYYERVYEIDGKLVQQGKLYRMKVDIVLGKSISYKKLQQLIDSDNTQVALHANLLYAKQLHKLKPFLDYQVINSIYTSLLLHDTTTEYKQHSLHLLIDTLLHANPTAFIQQIQQLQSIKKYYNTRHKKLYFIADMTQAFDMFTPILTKIYELMNEMDLMQVYNLAMNQVAEDIRLVREIIKPQTLQTFLSLFEQLTLEKFKSKQKEKSQFKYIHKKHVYEKDFNDILDEIEKDNCEYSSFIVVILGGDQISGHSSIITDDADSSSNQRQLNQLLHSEINRKIQQNYYHIVSIGTQLNNFLTKQGKLKKHIKNSPDLLEIDLIKKNMLEHFSQLEKFLQ